MKIVLSGCTGYIGKHLTGELASEGHEIISLTRRTDRAGLPGAPGIRYETWDGRDTGMAGRWMKGADAVINLAGESIAKGRWNESRKRLLVGSRVGPTAAIAAAIGSAADRPKVLVNASAVGYYGNVGEGDVTEGSPSGAGFLASLCVRWEETAMAAAGHGVRVVLPRIGFVIGGRGGALGRMALPFRFFAGGPIGSGTQWLPWVHISDVTGIIRFALAHDGLRGPVNAVSPAPARMRDFSAALGRALGRPSWMPVPGFAVRMMLGELAEMVLGGQKAVPAVACKAGYRFNHPALGPALEASVKDL